MPIKLPLTLVFVLIMLTSCKTTEQVQREKMVENLSGKIVKLQKDNADLSFAVSDLQEKLSHLQGKKGEDEYKQRELTQEIVNKIRADIEVIHEGLVSLKKEHEETKKEMQAQKEYISQVVNTLGKISATPVPTKKKKNQGPYDEAISLFDNGNCDQAVDKLRTQVENQKLGKNEKATVLHHLGVCEFKMKNFDNSIISLSKVVTNYSQASVVTDSLYYLGKNFMEKGQKEEAKQAFLEVIKRSPKSKQSDSAKKMMKNL